MKLISLNIEGNKHLERVLPFLERELPDVLCLQEVPEPEISRFAELGYEVYFLPMIIRPVLGVNAEEGVLYGVRTETTSLLEKREYYFTRPEGGVSLYDATQEALGVNSACIMADIVFGEKTYTIGTTHFTWTPHGPNPSNTQRASMGNLLRALSGEKPHLICGDFNIPRGKSPLYEKLTAEYRDEIPETYASSLDPKLHKLGGQKDYEELFTSFMVDYIFTKPPYTVSDVHFEFNVSDHAGVIATVESLQRHGDRSLLYIRYIEYIISAQVFPVIYSSTPPKTHRARNCP